MLGLSTGLVYESFQQEQISLDLTTINDLIGWWDFTDSSTMYSDAELETTSNSGLTNVSSDGDLITLIDNKAYTEQSNTTDAIGKFMKNYNSTAPRYTTGGAGGHSYACFKGQTSGIDSTATPRGLFCGKDNVQRFGGFSGELSNSTFDMDDFTFFIVLRPVTDDSNISSTLGPTAFGWHGRRSATNTIFVLHQQPDASGDYMSISGTKDLDTTVMDTGTQLWTCEGAGSGNSKLYKNGNTNVGVINGDLGTNAVGETFGMSATISAFFIGDNKVLIDNHNVGQNYSDWGGDGTDIDGDRVNAIYEVAFYKSALSSSDISTIEAYLKNKYGIT